MPFRLHIDIPLTEDEQDSIAKVDQLIANIVAMEDEMGLFYGGHGMKEIQVNYRLGHDDDRQKSNYIHKNENGHVSNKKSRIVFEYD